MALDGVPWIIGGGAIHSPSVIRAALHASLSGAEGVVGSSDLRVEALDTPGTSVRALPGSYAITNTYPGVTDQSYASRAGTETIVPITATGGSPRSDMVILRIDDPEYGGTSPADVTVGPYERVVVLTNVGAGATEVPLTEKYPAIPLARIDIPASTGTITSGMITNLRTLLNPKTRRELQMFTNTVSNRVSTNAAGGAPWPRAAGFNVAVPEWATEVKAVAMVGGALLTAVNVWGNIWIRMGTDGSAVSTAQAGYDSPSSTVGNHRESFFVGGEMTIPPAYRGTTVNFQVRAKYVGGAAGSQPLADTATPTILDLQFVQKTE